ncbi:hypothetical protein C8R44DRAFT_877781 [Mycena epipterygia]|nr:hypothetical protein C8R44DRAFT_877781 [Mycena epipterygia]
MGGNLWVVAPEDIDSEVDWDKVVSVYYRYSGFTDFKVILLVATIQFLTTLSAKQISKAMLVEEGVATAEAVDAEDEAIVIVNYRARIDAAISILRSWTRVPGSDAGRASKVPHVNLPGPGSPLNALPAIQKMRNMIEMQKMMAEIMDEIPLAFDKIETYTTPPHPLVELNLGGIHTFLKFPDANSKMPYAQAKEVERMMRAVKPYCVFGENWVFDEGEPHFIDEVIAVFEAAQPGGLVCN